MRSPIWEGSQNECIAGWENGYIWSAIDYFEAQLTRWKSIVTLHKNWSFPLKISSVNVTKSTGVHRIWLHLLKKSFMENITFYSVLDNFFADILAT